MYNSIYSTAVLLHVDCMIILASILVHVWFTYRYMYVCMTLYVCTSASYISLINYKGTLHPHTGTYKHMHTCICMHTIAGCTRCVWSSVPQLLSHSYRPELFLPIGDQVTFYYRNYHYSQNYCVRKFRVAICWYSFGHNRQFRYASIMLA